MTLQELKDMRYHDIDGTTQYIIAQGFTFAGNTFSLSYNAQINWTNLMILPEAAFPINISTMDENIYVLTFAERQNFYLAAAAAKSTPLFSGSALKSQVHNCADEACVNAIVDNRI